MSRVGLSVGSVVVVCAAFIASASPARTEAQGSVGPRARIAFCSYSARTLHVMYADGSGKQRLGRGTCAAAWSPDGRRIAFQSFRDGDDEIFVMNADGSGQRNLTRNKASDEDPAWSPDGRRIAFSSDRDGDDEIFVMSADGSGQRNLTRNKESDYAGTSALRPRASDLEPVWSPDGRRIAFESRRDGDDHEIFVMNADGSGQRNLTRNKASDEDPAWSPDGRRIAFQSNQDGDYEIFVVSPDGSGKRNLTQGFVIRLHNGVSYHCCADWSPDGRKIAFQTGGTRGDWEEETIVWISMMNADGSGKRRLTPNGTHSPVWSSDGHKIAFVWDSPAPEGGDIYVMNADGSGQRNLTRSKADEFDPVWLPAP